MMESALEKFLGARDTHGRTKLPELLLEVQVPSPPTPVVDPQMVQVVEGYVEKMVNPLLAEIAKVRSDVAETKLAQELDRNRVGKTFADLSTHLKGVEGSLATMCRTVLSDSQSLRALIGKEKEGGDRMTTEVLHLKQNGVKFAQRLEKMELSHEDVFEKLLKVEKDL